MTGLLALCAPLISCADEELYVATDRADAYISAMQIYTADNRNVAVSVEIDDETGIITATVKSGVNPARLKPSCSLAPEATIRPKMGVWTDFSQPVRYTVVAGNGVDKKNYVIMVVLQE